MNYVVKDVDGQYLSREYEWVSRMMTAFVYNNLEKAKQDACDMGGKVFKLIEEAI